MALLRDEGLSLRYLIVGSGPEEAAIQAEVARLGLQEQVQMLGAMDETRVMEVLGQVDALALISIGKGEAAPVAVMEAMSCGLPVICSIIGGTPDMITDGVDGFLVEQEDVAAIANRLKRLIKDRRLASQLGHAARAKALSHFDHRTNAAKLVKQIGASNPSR
jgi:glycosyltransferase involved in cell wall biosynthesis